MLIQCEDCKKMYSSKAKACPNCGCPNTFVENEEIMKMNQIWYEDKIFMSVWGFIAFCIVWFVCSHFNITGGHWQLTFVISLAIGGFISAFGTSMMTGVGMCFVIGLGTAWVCDKFDIPNFFQVLIFYVYMIAGFYVLFIRPFISFYKSRKYKKMAENVHDPFYYFEELLKKEERDKRRAEKAWEKQKEKTLENDVYNADYTEKEL